MNQHVHHYGAHPPIPPSPPPLQSFMTQRALLLWRDLFLLRESYPPSGVQILLHKHIHDIVTLLPITRELHVRCSFYSLPYVGYIGYRLFQFFIHTHTFMYIVMYFILIKLYLCIFY